MSSITGANANKKCFFISTVVFDNKEKLGGVAQFEKDLPPGSVKNIVAYSSENFGRPDWNKLGGFVIVTQRSGAKGF